LPWASLEALAWRLPVISTPVGGIPEALIDGETGFMVEPGNPAMIAEKVTCLLRDAVLRETLGNQAYTYVQGHFSLEFILQTLRGYYDALFE
jgi:glycosyltransferase involved in cell wall biosynthesis